ncbi:hypothetical protein IAR50_006891 [Cryptococcus sp. DSM 104548]
MSTDPQTSTRGPSRPLSALSDLLAGYVNQNPSHISSVISQHGSESFGSKTLSELRNSVDKTVEKGTALIKASTIDHGFPGLLLYPEGPFEVLSHPMEHAYSTQYKPTILVHRTLQSLDGTPTPLSDQDFSAIEELVMIQKAANRISAQQDLSLGGYDRALRALGAARSKAQLMEEPDEEGRRVYSLDLSSVPFSIQYRKSGWSVRAEPGKELAAWAWERVSEIHAEGPSNASVILELKDPKSERPDFFNDSKTRDRLTKRIHRTAQVSQSLFDIENYCSMIGIPAARYTNLADFTPHPDEMSQRFKRTLKNDPIHQVWLYDTYLASAAKGRELSQLETQALIPPRLKKEYSQATDEKLLHSAYRRQGVSMRPSDYILIDDDEYLKWQKEFATLYEEHDHALPWDKVPRQGFEELLEDVNSILEGKGHDVLIRRYDKENVDEGDDERKGDGDGRGGAEDGGEGESEAEDEEGETGEDESPLPTIAQDYENHDPLQYFLLLFHKDKQLAPQDLEEEMPPAAFKQWTDMQESGQAGPDTVWKDILEYREYQKEREDEDRHLTSLVSSQMGALELQEAHPTEES